MQHGGAAIYLDLQSAVALAGAKTNGDGEN